MANVIVKIPHISWRNGRPRFQPGPMLRLQGFKGYNLYGPTGEWMTLQEASEFSTALKTEIAQKQLDQPKPKRVMPRSPHLYTVADLIAETFKLKAFQIIEGETLAERKRRGGLAPSTIKWYKKLANGIQDYDPDLWTAPAAGISRAVAKGFYRRLREDKGLANSRAMIALLRRCWEEQDHKLPPNPFLRLKVKSPPPRLRVGEIEEMQRLIAAADAIGRPEIGDSIMLGLFTAQRQNDRLAATGGQVINGRLILKQSKRGAIVSIPIAWCAPLVGRLAKARERRQGHTVDYSHILIDEIAQTPWAPAGDHYRHVFAEVRQAAVSGVRGENDEWIVRPLQSLSDFTDQDLRDTAVTWLANAGATIPEICSLTGHEIGTVEQVLKHYLARHPDQADNAASKLLAWLDGKGAEL